MKTVTVNEILKTRKTCYSCYSEEKIRAIAGNKKEWSALDVLALDIPAKDRLFVVLSESFIDAAILHEFSCKVAERALALFGNPDPRSAGALVVKRRWLRGEATDAELAVARVAADAAAWAAVYAARAAARAAAHAAAHAARAAAHAASDSAARNGAWDVVSYAERAASAAERDAADVAAAAEDAAGSAEREEQVKILIELLREAGE
jgi:hypothetical protein